MTVFQATLEVESEARVTFHDVTLEVAGQLKSSGITQGVAVVSTPHTTCSVILQEESHDKTWRGVDFLMEDMTDILRKVVPDATSEDKYRHPGPLAVENMVRERSEKPWWGLNVDGHLRSVLLGRSENVPVIDGELALGEFGRIFFVDFDQMRARRRKVVATFLGE